MCLELVSRSSCCITFPGTEVRPLDTQVLFIPLLEARAGICVLPVFRSFRHNILKIIESGPTMTSASSFNSHECIPSDFMGLCMFSLFKQSLTIPSFSTEGKSLFLQTFTLVSVAWDSWWQILPEKNEVNKVFGTLTFCFFLMRSAPLIWWSLKIFSNLSCSMALRLALIIWRCVWRWLGERSVVFLLDDSSHLLPQRLKGLFLF